MLGVEIMNGKPDMLKGSYYANPTVDRPIANSRVRQAHASYLGHNIWPTEADCPNFESSYKALATFMTETGKRLAKACDSLFANNTETPSIEQLIATSECLKARLLHYYPPESQVVSISGTSTQPDSEFYSLEKPRDEWCGLHVDHSILTALCSSMYLFHPSQSISTAKHLEPICISTPTTSAGLFIQTRAGQTILANIPSDCLAFQTGEALQLLSRHKLRATPHFVSTGTNDSILPDVMRTIRRHSEQGDADCDYTHGVISRETMAVFLQPDVHAVIGADGETFGHFTERILRSHYKIVSNVIQAICILMLFLYL